MKPTSEAKTTSKPKEVGEERIKEAFKKQQLAVAGFSEEELAKYDMPSMTDEELYSQVRRRLLGAMEK